MAILSEHLSVWEISFRWVGLDPGRVWLRLPLAVQDHFRNLMDAILKGELDCESISLEKRDYEPDEIEFSVYFWLDDIYACIFGRRFNRKLLRHAAIDRYSFKLWCERMNIPLPEFWFPPGWNLEYQLPENDLPPGYWYVRKDWTAEDWAAWKADQNRHEEVTSSVEQSTPGSAGGQLAPAGGVQQAPELSESPQLSNEDKAAQKMRPSQEARIACQQIAMVIWKDEPDRTIASVVRDDLIQKYGGGSHYVDVTVREWVKVVAPPHVRDRRGRPKKGGEDV